MTTKAPGHPGLRRVSFRWSLVAVVQIRWISGDQCDLGRRHAEMKLTSTFGTGVAQTEALVGCCIQDAVRWITICSLQKGDAIQAEMKRRETWNGWGIAMAWWARSWGVRLCDASLMSEERLKPEATGTEPFFPCRKMTDQGQ